MRLLLDQGLPRSASSTLRLRGWQVEHVGELGMGSASDADILDQIDCAVVEIFYGEVVAAQVRELLR